MQAQRLVFLCLLFAWIKWHIPSAGDPDLCWQPLNSFLCFSQFCPVENPGAPPNRWVTCRYHWVHRLTQLSFLSPRSVTTDPSSPRLRPNRRTHPPCLMPNPPPAQGNLVYLSFRIVSFAKQMIFVGLLAFWLIIGCHWPAWEQWYHRLCSALMFKCCSNFWSDRGCAGIFLFSAYDVDYPCGLLGTFIYSHLIPLFFTNFDAGEPPVLVDKHFLP